MRIAISVRARQYGYVIWNRIQDEQMRQLLGQRDAITLVFRDGLHGEKRVDWRYRRISIGYKWTRMLPQSCKNYILRMADDGRLIVDVG